MIASTALGWLTADPTPSPSPTALTKLLKENPQLAEELAQQATSSRPDTTLWWCLFAVAIALVWFAVKHGAARGGPGSRAGGLYRRCDPWVQALRLWVAAAPVSFTYVATWTATTVIFQGTPETVAGVLNRFNSTNIFGILTEPVRVLFTSAFIVADYGFFYIGYVAVYVLIVARLEQRIGSARVIIVGAGSHVLGSLIIVALEAILIHNQVLASSTVITQDVGVSYVMVGAAGAYLFLVSARWRWWYRAALMMGVVLPVIVSQTIWDLGHLVATGVGIVLYLIVRRWGLRPRLTWRATAAAAQPRRLPTWHAVNVTT